MNNPQHKQKQYAHAKQVNPEINQQNTAKKKSGKKKKFFIAIALILILLVSALGLALGYFQTISDNLHKGIEDKLDTVLIGSSNVTEEPFYMLLVGTDKSKERDADNSLDGIYRTDSMILTRVDPINKKVDLVSLHRDTLMDFGQNGRQKLNAAYAIGGAPYAIKAASALSGVPISHYAEINFDGFKEVVDSLGGVEVDVPMEINDKRAGGHVDKGKQTLTGEKALILARARHAYDEYGDGDRYRAANQRLIIEACAKKILSSDPVTITRTAKTLSKCITTDLSMQQLLSLAQTFKDMDFNKNITSTMEPTTSQYFEGDGWYEFCDVENWKEMMRKIDQGQSKYSQDSQVTTTAEDAQETPSESTEEEASKPENTSASKTIDIQNGAGIKGAASQTKQRLTATSYTLKSGNANAFDYPETLIVYRNKDDATEALAIQQKLGCGRIVFDNNHYTFEGDFLVLIGTDWN